MSANDMTDFHRAQLAAVTARARAEVEAGAEYARVTGKEMPMPDPDDPSLKLYHKGGYFAMLFCIWFAMLSPIILILMYWD
ncbi:MAG: hypothetical protein WBA67_08575 [Jannaschia sp.]